MSTAVMASSAKYDFGDMLYKGHNARSSNTMDHPQKMLRWGEDSSERAVGAPVGAPVGTSTIHQTLLRRNSNPAGASAASITMISLASSVSTLILDNMRDQAQPHRKLDRSQSEPATSALINAAKAANINTSRYKTELCRPYEESGSCKYGDKCQFAHGIHELRNLVRHPKYKTELCRTFHTIGFCPYGPRCHFIHNAEEARTKMPSMPLASPALAVIKRPKPLSLTGPATFMMTGSTADSPSPNSSLSQSPTTSVGSFFSSEPDIFHTVVPSTPPPPTSANTAFSFCQDFNSLVQVGASKQRGPSPSESSLASISPVGSLSPRESPPPNSPEARLPVFNRLSSTVMTFGGLAELLA